MPVISQPISDVLSVKMAHDDISTLRRLIQGTLGAFAHAGKSHDLGNFAIVRRKLRRLDLADYY